MKSKAWSKAKPVCRTKELFTVCVEKDRNAVRYFKKGTSSIFFKVTITRVAKVSG